MDLAHLLSTAFRKRQPLYGDPATNCFRLFNGAGDGLDGLALDWYHGYVLAQYYKEPLFGMSDELLRGIDAAAGLLPAAPAGILMKNRMKQEDAADIAAVRTSILLRGGEPPEGHTVMQNGVRAAVDLVWGQSTGIFLDMREVRDRLAPYYAPADTMLNLFSYTAIFSVHAVRHGITGAVNVDLSRAVLERARVNYGLNGIRVDERDFIYGDSLDWIRRFRKKGRTFSFVVFDPPTFSRNRQTSFSTRRDYADALSLLAVIAPGGHALTSVNSFTITGEQYRSFHPGGWKLEFFCNESSDFTRVEDAYLKVGLWRIP
jgi:23S rRNA (cytosine1962-C5)-methyltransferase